MRSMEYVAYLIEVSLVKLLHGSLELTALRLPLLIVAHGLCCGPLPCCGSGVVIHIVKPSTLIHTLLPTTIQTRITD